MQYFIKRKEKVNGPFTAAQIKSATKSGKLKETDLISNTEGGPWKPLSQALGKSAEPATPDKGGVGDEDVAASLGVDKAADELDDSRAKEIAEYEHELQLIAQKRAEVSAQKRTKPPALQQALAEVSAQKKSGSQFAITSTPDASHSDAIPASNRTRLFIGIGIGAGVVTVGVVVVAIAVIFAFSGNKDDKQDAIVQSEDSQNGAAIASAAPAAPEQLPPTPAATVDKELFENAIRAAMAFSPSTKNTLEIIPLTDELRLIKPALKSKADQDLYAVLEKIEVVEKDIQTLTVARFSKSWTGLRASLETSWLGIKAIVERNPGILKDKRYDVVANYEIPKKNYEMAVLAEKIATEGGVIISISSGNPKVDTAFSKFMNKGQVPGIAKKYNITTSVIDGITFFPAKELEATLKALNSTLIDAANSMRFGK